MKVLVLRKKSFWERKKSEDVFFEDIEVRVVYITMVTKKVRRMAEGFEHIVSVDFKEFFSKSTLMAMLAEQCYQKICLRHGNVDPDVLEVQADVLNDENAEILIRLALNARYVILHTAISHEKFDFLCDEAGVSPEFAYGNYRQNMVVHLGEEFLIKHVPTGKIYYDVLIGGEREYCLDEVNMIYTKYFKKNPLKLQDVKIRELMSK